MLRPMRIRCVVLLGLFVMAELASLPVGQARGQAPQTRQVSSDPDPEKLTPAEVVKRDALMAPGIEELKQNNPAAAYEKLQPALAAYPEDLRTLRYAAMAAMGANKNEEALTLFERALGRHPGQPWPLRLSILTLESRLGRWNDFNRNLAALRAAKKEGTDPQLAGTNGFVIEEFEAGGKHVQAVVFPTLSGRYHTLYRFLLPKSANLNPQTSASAQGTPAQCQNPEFRPYLDVESDDIDQVSFKKAHPDRAEKGDRSYSLDVYPAPCSQGLIKFYLDGEPTYEAVRADVIRSLTAPGGSGKP